LCTSFGIGIPQHVSGGNVITLKIIIKTGQDSQDKTTNIQDSEGINKLFYYKIKKIINGTVTSEGSHTHTADGLTNTWPLLLVRILRQTTFCLP
jgi:hypothetical protein